MIVRCSERHSEIGSRWEIYTSYDQKPCEIFHINKSWSTATASDHFKHLKKKNPVNGIRAQILSFNSKGGGEAKR